MGLVYAPGQPIGKGATSGNIRNFNPKLGGGFSRIGTIIEGVRTGYRFVKANRKLFTGIGAVATGAGVDNLVGLTNNQLSETYHPGKPFNSRFRNFSNNKFRRRERYNHNKCCRCENRNRNQGVIRRNVGSRRRRPTRSNYYYR